MAHAPSITSQDDPAFDRHSIELSIRSSRISRPDAVRPKRRFEDVVERYERRRPLLTLPTVSEGAGLRSDDSAQAIRNTQSHANSRTKKGTNGLGRASASDPGERTPLISHLAATGRPLYEDDRAYIRWPAAFMHLTWMVLSSNYANTLLALFPLACLAHELHWHAGFTLVFSGLPMLPLSLLIALSVEELSYKIGPTLSGVLSYSFGNVGTVIISCVLLRRGEILVVQTSLLGAIVFNLLAVIGCQYLASGVFRQEAVFNETIAQVNGSVLLLAVGTIALPAVLRQVQGEESVVVVSRGLAVPSMITYLLLLVFQFKTHSVLYNEWLREDEEEEDDSKEPSMLAPMPAIILLVAATA